MERLGIFVFYDKSGIVSEYVLYLLNELKSMINYQIVIVNGSLQPESKEVLLQISNKLIIRENIGFDGGAYKDVFQNYLPKAELEKYDELVLCNDSFYGPLFPFAEIWDKMEHSSADFWGLTRHPKGTFGGNDFFPGHIQSYFLTIKRSLFLTDEFQEFWDKEVAYEKKYRDVVKGFEIKFTRYFESKGFVGVALSDFLKYYDITIHYNENPFLQYSYELISTRISPVLKRKALVWSYNCLEKGLQAYDYICKETIYPEHMIRDHIKRLNKEGNWCDGWDLEKLENFYMQHDRLYLYGAGLWGGTLKTYFNYRGWKISGVFVSEGRKIIGAEQIFSSNSLKKTDGIVVALGKKNLDVVIQNLREVLDEEQLFVPAYK